MKSCLKTLNQQGSVCWIISLLENSTNLIFKQIYWANYAVVYTCTLFTSKYMYMYVMELLDLPISTNACSFLL